MPLSPSEHPVLQLEHDAVLLLPAREYGSPGGHASQRAVVATQKVPAGQGTRDPVSLVDPAGQKDPVALHTPLQAAELRPELEPNRPTGHGVHRDAPPREYVPAGHAAVQREAVAPALAPYLVEHRSRVGWEGRARERSATT